MQAQAESCASTEKLSASDAQKGNLLNTRYFTITDPARGRARRSNRLRTFCAAAGCSPSPTETVYGLGADGLNADAVRHIF